jgi:outer membrane protein assembly factor BamB
MSHDLQEGWRYEDKIHNIQQFDSDKRGIYTQFVVFEGKIFAVQVPSSLFCLDMEGSLLWSIETKGVRMNFPAAANDNLCVGTTDEILYLDASTGEVLWRYETEFVNFSSSPIIVDSHIIVGSGQPYQPLLSSSKAQDALNHARKVLCLDANNGKVVWEFFCREFVDSSPAYFDGRVFINDGNTIYCLDADTGTLFWEKTVKKLHSSVSLDGERLFVGTYEGILHCLDLETGKSLWKTDCGGSFYAPPVTAYNKVYIGSGNGVCYCLDAERGDVVWTVESGSGIYSSSVVADGKVAFGTESGKLYIVDAESGNTLGYFDLDGSGITALALSDRKLICGEENGRIICFGEIHDKRTTLVILVIALCAMLSAGIWYQRMSKSKTKPHERELQII